MRIVNGRWLDDEGILREGDVVVSRGRIVSVHGQGPDDGVVVDARDCRILPGAVDAHVHLREPGNALKEGVANGTRAAVAGGVTTVLDMPNDVPATTDRERVEAKARIFRRDSRCHFGLHGHATTGASDLDPRRIASVKVYMARSSEVPAIRDVASLRKVFSAFPRVAIHAEDEAFFGPGDSHAARRPREAVRRALQTVEEALAGAPRRPRVVLCHVATTDEVAWLRRMKAARHDVRGETCPHYLAFTENDVRREGARLQVNPPIRGEADRQALRRALADGTIDILASDHAPHTPAEKGSPNPPSGIASVEWLLPFAAQLVAEGVLTWKRLVDVVARNPSACYGLAGGGGIAEGRRADIVVLGRQDFVHPRKQVVTRAGWTPYRFDQFAWHVRATVVGGTIAYKDGEWPVGVHGEELYK